MTSPLRRPRGTQPPAPVPAAVHLITSPTGAACGIPLTDGMMGVDATRADRTLTALVGCPACLHIARGPAADPHPALTPFREARSRRRYRA